MTPLDFINLFSTANLNLFDLNEALKRYNLARSVELVLHSKVPPGDGHFGLLDLGFTLDYSLWAKRHGWDYGYRLLISGACDVQYNLEFGNVYGHLVPSSPNSTITDISLSISEIDNSAIEFDLDDSEPSYFSLASNFSEQSTPDVTIVEEYLRDIETYSLCGRRM